MENKMLLRHKKVLFLTIVIIMMFSLQPVFAQSNLVQEEGVIFDSVNEARGQVGLPSLKRSARLDALAMIRAEEIAQSFSHVRPNGEGFNSLDPQVMHGENIVYGTNLSGSSAHSLWMNSQGHRENILRDGYHSIGIGSYATGGHHYFVQIFSRIYLEDTPVDEPVTSETSEILDKKTNDEQVEETLHKEKNLEYYRYQNKKLEAEKAFYTNRIQSLPPRLYR